MIALFEAEEVHEGITGRDVAEIIPFSGSMVPEAMVRRRECSMGDDC